MRDHRGISFASLYTIIENKMGDIFLTGQNQCHITGVKKSYFCHTFHLRPKKVSWWQVVGGGWKVTLVSVCVHFLKLLDTQTQKWTQSLTILIYFWVVHRLGLNFIFLIEWQIMIIIILAQIKPPLTTTSDIKVA